jgi:xanthine/uracil/vitamin C permease (AzgA family)
MLALLFVLCLLILVGCVVAALLGLMGVVSAVATGLLVLNAAAVIVGAIVQRRRRAEAWAEIQVPLPEAATREPIVADEPSIRVARIPHLH